MRIGRVVVGMVAITLLSFGLFHGVVRGVTTLFPDGLYEYVPSTGLVDRKDFEEVATQLTALQAWLGLGGSRVPTGNSPCVAFVEDTGLSDLRELPTFFLAPKPGQLVEAYCDTVGAGSTSAMDLIVDDGSPATITTVGCNTSGVTTPLAIPLGLHDKLRARIVQPLGLPVAISLCLTFAPGQ